MNTWTAMAAIVLILLVGQSARALHSTNHISVAGWNDSGTCVLLNNAVAGPEGGGSSTYWILSDQGTESQKWTISSDFSPGDGSQPQTVSVAQCRQCLAQLSRSLSLNKFSSVNVNIASCTKSPRGPVTSGAASRLRNADSGQWKVNADSGGRLFLNTGTNTVVLPSGNLYSAGTYLPEVGPGARMLLVFAWDNGETTLAGAWRFSDNDITKPVSLSPPLEIHRQLLRADH